MKEFCKILAINFGSLAINFVQKKKKKIRKIFY